ncbi:LytTR family DNA-binding domain-containing protein [Bacteroidota bacterium]
MILKYLKQSYPLVENRWKIILPITAFVGFFMVIFQPFGLSGYLGEYKYLLLAGYGLVTFLLLLLNLFLIPAFSPSFFKEKSWKIWKELLFLLWIIITIGLGNLYYTSLFFHIRFSFSSVLTVELFTLAIGIIPITTITIVKQNYLNRKNRIGANQLSEIVTDRKQSDLQGDVVQFVSDNEKDEISIRVADLLLVDAEGNYITVYYLKNGSPTSSLLRNTLLYAELVVAAYPEIFKCHRSFLVNLYRIQKVNGNSQGYRLVIPGIPEEVPVSRSNAGRLKELLSN